MRLSSCVWVVARRYASTSKKPLVGPAGVLQPASAVELRNLRDVPGAKKAKRRLGRGQASGKGTQAGKGHKGKKARTGAKTPTLFEGGQATLGLRVRKYGFTNKTFRKELEELNLDRVQRFVDKGLLDTSQKITMKVLKDSGLLSHIHHGVKLLSKGKDTFKAKIDLEVTAVSKQAKEAVEKAGGSVTTVYFNRLGLLTHLRTPADQVKIRFARAPPQLWKRFDVPKYPSPVDKYYEQVAALSKQ